MTSSEFATSVKEIQPVVRNAATALAAIATILGIVGTLASAS